MNKFNQLISQINHSKLSAFFNANYRWTSSIVDIQKDDVLICLVSNGSSCLKYLTSENIPSLKGILIETKGIDSKDYHKQLDLLDQYRIPYELIFDLRDYLHLLASYLYPIKNYPILTAVSGTNGKTSICQFINQLYDLSQFQQKSFYSGTLGIGINDNLKPSQLTTPDIFNFCYHLNLFAQSSNKANKFGAFEFSSHALAQNRLKNIPIKTAVLSNISHDHLDYHISFANYFAAKQKLLQQTGLENVIINIDDDNLYSLACKISKNKKLNLITVSSKQKQAIHSYAHLSATDISYDIKGINFVLHYLTQKEHQQSQNLYLALYGSFNIDNILLALASLLVLNKKSLSFERLINYLGQLQAINGRMQLINNFEQKFLCFVDYAHSPDGLQRALLGLKEHFNHRYLICVFGCGGNRDKSKRPLMGAIATSNCDQVIITADNCRNESFDNIASDITGNLKTSNYKIIANRKMAIDYAFNQAIEKSAVLLLAGKGHESVQISADKVQAFNDGDYLKEKLKKIA